VANTTWSTTDKSAGITLSNANLTAAGGTGSVRSVDRQLSGKLYWEYTFVTGGTNNPAVGIATARADLASLYANATNGVLVYPSSPIYVNGVSSGINLGAIGVGGIVGVALDLTNNLIWMRSGAAGNWNANAANNPATGVGGLSIAAFAGGSIPVYAATATTGSATITANFGDTAFTGVVPAGFTSGFTAGTTPPLNMLATQAAIEDWRVPSDPAMQVTQVAIEDWRVPIPDAQVTQIGLEHWYSANPDIQITQVLLEHWASVAETVVAYTTWSTTDKSASLNLTGSNLIATAGAATVSVRGKDPKRTGKYYVEYTSTTTQGNSSYVGFGAAKSPFGVLGNVSSSFTVWAQLGTNVAFDSFGATIGGLGNQSGGFTTGTLICAAIDLDNQLVWFRMSAAGNWNNSAANNPATGVGGFSLRAVGLGQGIDVYPFLLLQTIGNSITANFGGSAFTGAVPSGFTAGWDDSVSIVTNMVATQLALEEWGSGNPAMQLTQILMEEWASVAAAPPPSLSSDVRVMIMA